MKNCAQCSAQFEPRKSGKPQRFCSKECKQAWHIPKSITPSREPNRSGGREFECAFCGKKSRTRLRGGGRRQLFCSQQCAAMDYNRRNPKAFLSVYGMTPEDYEKQLASQGGACAICGRPPQSRSLDVDHCHATNFVRGLLCNPCNRHLGYYETFREQIHAYLGREKLPFRFVGKRIHHLRKVKTP